MVYPAVNDNASVPEVLIGLPDIERPVGVVMATLVTVPPLLETRQFVPFQKQVEEAMGNVEVAVVEVAVK